MKGNNTITLNHAEMKRALEYYLNEVQFKEKVVVNNIEQKREGPGGYSSFEITLYEEIDEIKERGDEPT